MPPHLLIQFDRADLNLVIGEADAAEHNINAVLAAASRTQAVFSQFKNTGFQISEIQSLASDLKATFALIRLSLRHEYPLLNLSGRRIASRNDALPDRLARGGYSSLCPLTLYLQQITQFLSRLNIVNAGGDPRHIPKARENWGSVKPLQGILASLGKTFSKSNSQF